MIAYQPDDVFTRHTVQITFAKSGFSGRVFVTFPTDLWGADVIAACIAPDPDEGEEEEEEEGGPSMIDLLVNATADPRNRNRVSAIEEEGEIVGVAVHLTNEAGQSMVLTHDIEAHVVGVSIVSVETLSEAEVEALTAAGMLPEYDDDSEGE